MRTDPRGELVPPGDRTLFPERPPDPGGLGWTGSLARRAGFWWWGPEASGPQPCCISPRPELGTWAWSTADAVELQSSASDSPRLGRSRTAEGGLGCESLAALNPLCRVQAIDLRLNQVNVREVVRGFELVLDASDNFPTRFLVSECCWQERIPLVSAAATGWHGQLLVVRPGARIPVIAVWCPRRRQRRPCPPPLKWVFWARWLELWAASRRLKP